MAPAGQAWSTVADLARWARFLALGHPDVLDAASLREAGTPALAADYGLGLRVLDLDGRTLVGHTGSMPGFLASLFVEPGTGDGCVALANATTGLDTDGVPRALLGARSDPGPRGTVGADHRPARRPPPSCWACGSGATPRSRPAGTTSALHLHNLALAEREEVFRLSGGAWRRHLGLPPRRAPRRPPPRRRRVGHLTCATFVYTRVPYDADVDIPGGHPR